MFFKVKNKYHISTDFLRSKALLTAYSVIKSYPLKASELILDQYIQQLYNVSLKNMSIELLLNSTFYTDDAGNLVLLFKNPRHDAIAQLITYGNGVVPGSKILKIALSG